MGFRKDAYCTVWSVESISKTMTKARISISYKNKQTDQYEQEFGGFVTFVGTACANKALGLKEKSRIRLGDVDVTNSYDAKTKKEYTNFKVFSFETENDEKQSSSKQSQATYEEEDPDDLPF